MLAMALCLQAQLRAAVFHVMHEHEMQDDDPLLATRNKLRAFKQDDGDLALAIVLDFLAFFDLEHSLAVLKAEANAESSIQKSHEVTMQLTKLRERLGIMSDHKEGTGGSTQRSPLLIQMLLQQSQSHLESKKESVSTGGGTVLTSRDQRPTDDAPHNQGKSSFYADNAQDNSSDAGFTRSKADETEVKDGFMRWKLSSERPPSSTMTSITSVSTRPEAENSGDEAEDEDTAAKISAKAKDKEESESEEDDKEEIVSGSELSESIAEEQSTSLNYSQDCESASKDFDADVDEKVTRGTAAAGSAQARAAGIRKDEYECDAHGDSGDEDVTKGEPTAGSVHFSRDGHESDDDEVAGPPPVPTKLSSPLPVATSSTIKREPPQDDDEFDEVRNNSTPLGFIRTD